MGPLGNTIVASLLATSSQHKQDVVEQRIRDLLGATPLQVTKLPARRGKSDGGIDGVVMAVNLHGEVLESERVALNVKVRSDAFSREQLGGFLLDMDREKIRVGIIITASGMAPDADSEMRRKNSEGGVLIKHVSIAEIISGDIGDMGLLFNGKTIGELIRDNIVQLIG